MFARSTLINRYLLAPLIGPIINLFLKYMRKVSANETLDYERSSIVDEFLSDTFNANRGGIDRKELIEALEHFILCNYYFINIGSIV